MGQFRSRLQPGMLAVLGVAALLALADGKPHEVRAQTSPALFSSPPIFDQRGLANAVFMGGSVDELDAAALATGASGAWAQDSSGTFQLLILGGPAFLKDGFKARFPGGLGVTAVTLTRSAGETPTPGPRPPTPSPLPAKLTIAISLHVSSTSPAAGAPVTVTGATDRDIGPLPVSIVIVQDGRVILRCDEGSTCSTVVAGQTNASATFQAHAVEWDAGGLSTPIANSTPAQVTWHAANPAPAPAPVPPPAPAPAPQLPQVAGNWSGTMVLPPRTGASTTFNARWTMTISQNGGGISGRLVISSYGNYDMTGTVTASGAISMSADGIGSGCMIYFDGTLEGAGYMSGGYAFNNCYARFGRTSGDGTWFGSRP